MRHDKAGKVRKKLYGRVDVSNVGAEGVGVELEAGGKGLRTPSRENDREERRARVINVG